MSELDIDDYSAFSFDFDGTLADTVATHNLARARAFAQLAEETGDDRFVTIPDDLQHEAHRHGSNPTAIIGWLFVEAGIAQTVDDPIVVQAADLKREKYVELSRNGLEQIPGSVETLRWLLNKAPARVGITTTAYREPEVVPFLVKYGLRGQMPDEHLITFEDIHPHPLKPDPYAYELTAQRFGLGNSPDYLLIFEDTPGGIASARAAGVTAVAVCTTHAEAAFDVSGASLRPNYIFPGFAEILAKAAA